MNKEYIVIDCETDGLYGRVWAVCAKKVKDGEVIAEFQGRSHENPTNPWVIENVFAHNADIVVLDDLHAAFAAWWKENKGPGVVWAHMGSPVESGFFRELNKRGLMGDFDGPVPLHDIATLLLARGMDPLSVDMAAAEFGVRPEGSPHDCRYDVAVSINVVEMLTK